MDSLEDQLKGVRLSYFGEFVNQNGGDIVFKNKTTTDVCEDIVKPLTSSRQLSLCEVLKAENHPSIGKAQVFVSHAWKFIFLDVVQSLNFHFRDTPNIIVWFDLFSNNQHKAVSLDYEWWADRFKSSISEIGHCVMVISPWQDPIPLKRAWCLFELYCTFTTNSRFEIAMSQQEQRHFLNDISSDNVAISAMLSSIDVEKSECYKPEDRVRIFECVQNSIGFRKLNQLVINGIRRWILAAAQFSIDSAEREEDSRILNEGFINLMRLFNPEDFMEIDEQHTFASQLTDALIDRLIAIQIMKNGSGSSSITYNSNVDDKVLNVQDVISIGYHAIYSFVTRKSPFNGSESMYSLYVEKSADTLHRFVRSISYELESQVSPDSLVIFFDMYKDICECICIMFGYLDRYYVGYNQRPSLASTYLSHFIGLIRSRLDVAEVDLKLKDFFQHLYTMHMYEDFISEKSIRDVAEIGKLFTSRGILYAEAVAFITTFRSLFPTCYTFYEASVSLSDASSPQSSSRTDREHGSLSQLILFDPKATSDTSRIFVDISHPFISQSLTTQKLVSNKLLFDPSKSYALLPCFATTKLIQIALDFCLYHATMPFIPIDKPLRSANMAELVTPYDSQLLESVSMEELFDLILFANYFAVQDLLELTCAKIASLIKGKTANEIRQTFNIENDFSPEEEARISDENRWCSNSDDGDTLFSINDASLRDAASSSNQAKEGWLLKRCGWLRWWRPRYFVLRGRELLYYYSEPSPSDTAMPRGRILIENAVAESDAIIKINASGTRQVYFLKADSNVVRNSWLNVLMLQD